MIGNTPVKGLGLQENLKGFHRGKRVRICINRLLLYRGNLERDRNPHLLSGAR